MNESSNPSAVVTGGTSGIGLAIVNRLVETNWDVTTVSRRHHSSFDHERVDHISADLSDPESPSQVAAELCTGRQSLNLLVNCAGSIGGSDGLSHITAESLAKSYSLHAIAPVMLALGLRSLLGSVEGQASVVNVGSIYGDLPDPEVLAYGAAKSSLHYATRCLSAALGPDIRVNAVLPGHVDTPMTDDAPSEWVADVERRTPLRRLAHAEEVADVVLFLASEHAQFVSGALVRCDGGYSDVSGPS